MLFQIGNNDTKDHDQAINSTDAPKYYADLWTSWFEKMNGNAALKNNSAIKSDFMKGGFFRYDVSSEVSVLVLDTMYYLIDNDQSPEGQTP